MLHALMPIIDISWHYHVGLLMQLTFTNGHYVFLQLDIQDHDAGTDVLFATYLFINRVKKYQAVSTESKSPALTTNPFPSFLVEFHQPNEVGTSLIVDHSPYPLSFLVLLGF